MDQSESDNLVEIPQHLLQLISEFNVERVNESDNLSHLSPGSPTPRPLHQSQTVFLPGEDELQNILQL